MEGEERKEKNEHSLARDRKHSLTIDVALQAVPLGEIPRAGLVLLPDVLVRLPIRGHGNGQGGKGSLLGLVSQVVVPQELPQSFQRGIVQVVPGDVSDDPVALASPSPRLGVGQYQQKSGECRQP